MPAKSTKPQDPRELAQIILDHVQSLDYGQVIITVHASQVVQIDKVERTRVDLKPQSDLGGGI